MPDCALFRGALVDPVDEVSWRAEADAGLLVEGGRIRAAGPFDAVARQAPGQEAIPLDGVIVPGFTDIHIHWVQQTVRGQYADQLLPWLKTHIWPAECRYGDADTAARDARLFFSDMLRAGTTMGMAYSSPHPHATRAAFGAMRGDWRLGPALMTANSPPELVAASPRDPADLKPLLAALGTRHFALTPRFAVSASAADLRAWGRWAARHGLHIQTHLAESPGELEEVARLFPDARDYTDVYDAAGLLGPQTVLGHCLHLREREWECLAARGAWIAHCPTSNEALQSGCFDLASARRHRVPFALGSDVGAGPSHSMLHVMGAFLRLHRAQGVAVRPEEALYRATHAGAVCMGRGGEAGRLVPGRRADFVLLPRGSGRFDPRGWFEDIVTGSPAELEARPLGTWLRGTCAPAPLGESRPAC